MGRRITRLCAVLVTGVELPAHAIPTRGETPRAQSRFTIDV